MRYTLATHPARFPTVSLFKRFFPERDSVQEPRSYSLAELATHRCVGFTPLPRKDDSRRY